MEAALGRIEGMEGTLALAASDIRGEVGSRQVVAVGIVAGIAVVVVATTEVVVAGLVGLSQNCSFGLPSW